MKMVKCINERTTYPGQITVGSRYWMDECSVWKDSDGDEYATFYTYHIPSEKYKLGQFKTSHFEMEIEEEKGWTITYYPWEVIKSHNVDLTKCKVIVSSERLFDFEDNQLMWDTYFNGSMEEWDKENRAELESTVWADEQKMKEAKKLTAYQLSLDKSTPYNIAFIKKKQSLQQYKPIVLQFEEYVGKSFNEITAKDVEDFRQVTDKPHRINHLNAFFIYCVRVGVMKNRDKEFLIGLLPDIYKEVGKVIAGLK